MLVLSDGYGLSARVYDLVLEPFTAPLREIARRLHPVPPSSVVLDIGCGTGAALADYRDAGCRVLGADASPAMLRQARSRLGPSADLRQTDGERVPFDDGVADLVLISLVLHSVDRPTAIGLLRESARVLAPTGRILVTDFGTGPIHGPRGWLTRGLTAVAEMAAGPNHARNSMDYLRASGLDPLVSTAGLATDMSRPIAGGNIIIAVLRPA